MVLIALLIALTLAGSVSAQENGEAGFKTGDGTSLYLRVSGVGEDTLIVLHGGPGFSSEYFNGFLKPLEKRFTVVYYDQRASGRSESPTDTTHLTADYHVRDLESLRIRLGLERVNILGHSWGAGLAALYATAHPDRLERLILVGPMPARATPHLETFSSVLQERRDSVAQEGLRRASEDSGLAPQAACQLRMEALQRGYFFDPDRSGELAPHLCRSPFGSLVSRHTWKSIDGYDWRPDLESVGVPVLIFHGEADPIPMSSVHEWVEALPRAELVIVPRSGHYPFIENPDYFFPRVMDFLGGAPWDRR